MTYYYDIGQEHTFKTNLRIIVSQSAARELTKLGLMLEDCKTILEEGYDAPRKRKKGTIEKWLDRGKKTYNAVIKQNYDKITGEEVWVLIHIGKFTRRKQK